MLRRVCLNKVMNNYTQRKTYDYHQDTVGISDHAWARQAQRLSHLTAADQGLVKGYAMEAAANSKGHTGVKVLSNTGGDVWVIVAGRTVKTLIVTTHGVHLDQTSQCNRYYIRPDAR